MDIESDLPGGASADLGARPGLMDRGKRNNLEAHGQGQAVSPSRG